MWPNIGTSLALITVGLAKEVIELKLEARRHEVLRARGYVEGGCWWERGDIGDRGVIEKPWCCYSGFHNNETVCEEKLYPDEYPHEMCRNKDTYRVVVVDNVTHPINGECILILWNVTPGDVGGYIAKFPWKPEDDQPMQIKMKEEPVLEVVKEYIEKHKSSSQPRLALLIIILLVVIIILGVVLTKACNVRCSET